MSSIRRLCPVRQHENRKHVRFALKKRRKHTRLMQQTRLKNIVKAFVLCRKSAHKHTRLMPQKVHERRLFNKQ